MIADPAAVSHSIVFPYRKYRSALPSATIQNLIDDWSAPKPIDAFYKRVFNMTYAEKKAQEDAEYFYYDENGKKKEVRKSKEETQSIH